MSSTQKKATRARPRQAVAPDAKLLKALSHPLRWRILQRMNEGEASPVMVARELGVSVPLASYHVKVLVELDCLELVKTEPRRGAVEHYYRATRRAYLDERQWSGLTNSQRQAITGVAVNEMMLDALGALHAGTIDSRDERCVLSTPLLLDERGWVEVNHLLTELLDRALALQAEAAGEIIEGQDDQRLRSTLTLLHYESAPGKHHRLEK